MAVSRRAGEALEAIGTRNTNEQLAGYLRVAVDQEAHGSSISPPLVNATAVPRFSGSGPEHVVQGYSRGLAYFLAADLARVSNLTVLGVVEIETIRRELNRAQNEPDRRPATSETNDRQITPTEFPRWGRLVGTSRVIRGEFSFPADSLLQLSATIQEVGDHTIKVGIVSGSFERPLAVEKLLLGAILDSLGISPPLGERRDLLRAPSVDNEAFLAFSLGRISEDVGNAEEARTYYREAAKDRSLRSEAQRRIEVLSMTPLDEMRALTEGLRLQALVPAFQTRMLRSGTALGLRQRPTTFDADLPPSIKLTSLFITITGTLP